MGKKHHVLGPSSMSRILACPGSKHAPASLSNDAAVLGTRIHAAAEGEDVDRASLSEAELELLDSCVREWQEFLIGILPDKGTWEQEVYLCSKEIADFGGTADLVVVTDEAIHVGDLKTGQGAVSAAENAQLACYLNLARERFGPRERYYGTIVQPALGYKETCEYSAAFLESVRDKVRAAAASDERFAGAHCRYCPLLETCETALGAAEALIPQRQIEPAPFPEDLARWKAILDYADVYEKLASVAKGKLLAAITDDGIKVPGYKAIAHGAKRGWANEFEAAEALRAMGFRDGQLFESRLLSPAQAEKLGAQVPEELVYKPEPVIILAKASNWTREATIANGQEFD